MIHRQALIDDAKCVETVRTLRWPPGEACCSGAKGRRGRRSRLKGKRGRGTLATEQPPIFGMSQRGGEVVMRRLENGQQRTLKPLIQATRAPGPCMDTAAYAIESRVAQWGEVHASVCHSRGHRRGMTTAMASMPYT